jgi:hypothetical protein
MLNAILYVDILAHVCGQCGGCLQLAFVTAAINKSD